MKNVKVNVDYNNAGEDIIIPVEGTSKARFNKLSTPGVGTPSEGFFYPITYCHDEENDDQNKACHKNNAHIINFKIHY